MARAMQPRAMQPRVKLRPAHGGQRRRKPWYVEAGGKQHYCRSEAEATALAHEIYRRRISAGKRGRHARTRRASRIRYVTCIAAYDTWQVTDKQQRKHRCKTYSHAVALACRLHECRPEDLAKPLSLQELRSRMRAFGPLCMNRLPGDLEHLCSMAVEHAGLFRREPYLMFIAAGLKYGFARDVLLSECTHRDYRIMSSPGPLSTRVARVHKMLLRVASKLDESFDEKAVRTWSQNCGSGVA